MTKIKIKSLVWDDYNIEHIKKHNVSIAEVEEAGKKLIYHRKTKKNRYLTVGRSKSRIITLIIRRLKLTTYFLVTARDTSKKERSRINEKELS